MFSDIDHKDPQVRQEIFSWMQWLASQLQLGGLRLDAIKHYSREFIRDLIVHIDQTIDRDWFIVGEYWVGNSEVLSQYIEYMDHRISLFDVKLLFNFSQLSLKENSDLRTIFNESLALYKPLNAVVGPLHTQPDSPNQVSAANSTV
jgi:alpha-amylase